MKPFLNDNITYLIIEYNNYAFVYIESVDEEIDDFFLKCY